MNGIYKEGLNRKQQLLFPPSIDDYVNEDNLVRAIDSYVEILDLSELGFKQISLKLDGQPAFHPKLLLKIYIYGYLNKIRSSRNLEKEVKRNIEMMWLTQGLSPGYKTIANFRKDNPKALKKVFKEFVLLCKNIELIEGKLIAIDGAFLRANASKNRLIMKSTTIKYLEKIDSKIEKYLTTLDYSDQEEKRSDAITPFTKNIDKLRIKKKKLKEDLSFLENRGTNQYNKTDPDASVMKKPAHNLVAYNSQIAVDAKYKFIVATDISIKGNDLNEFYNMASQSKEILAVETLNATADTGYYKQMEIKKCIDDNITPIIPKTDSQKAQKDKGKFTRDEFIYDKQNDNYLCPNNQALTKSTSTLKKDDKLSYEYRAKRAACKSCPIRDQCLPPKTLHKKLFRWEHEKIIEEHTKLMQTDEAKAIVKKRGSIVEHPFGTIKRMLGWDHFLVRGKEKVSGENALIMFTYNFRRLINLIGIALFQKLLIAIKEDNIESIREEIAQYIASLCSIWTHFIQKVILFKLKEKRLLVCQL